MVTCCQGIVAKEFPPAKDGEPTSANREEMK